MHDLTRKRRTLSRKTIDILLDDRTNETIPEGQGETITFAIDGAIYEIDLLTSNASRVRRGYGRLRSEPLRTARRAAGRDAWRIRVATSRPSREWSSREVAARRGSVARPPAARAGVPRLFTVTFGPTENRHAALMESAAKGLVGRNQRR